MMTLNALTQAAATVSTSGAESMTDMMDILLMITFIAGGIYCIYTFITQRGKAMVPENKIICPSNSDPSKCRHPKEFMQYMLPRTLVLGIGLVIFGLIFVIERSVGGYHPWLAVLLMVLPLSLLAWFVVAQRKAVKLYWK